MRAVLLTGGRVLSPDVPGATAMLVLDGIVAWVGRDRDAASYAEGAERVHLRGALVTPAFVDAHVHTTETGLAMDGVDLRGTATLGEALDRVADRARHRPGAMVLGHGWDEQAWPERRAPTAAELDRATGGAVVYLSRVDVHTAAVSTALLDRAPGVVTASGWAGDGLVRRTAHDLARRATRDRLAVADRRSAQRRALRRAASVGIGVLHEIAAPHIGPPEDLLALLALTVEEPLPDVVPYWGRLHAVDEARELGVRGLAGDLCLDGTMGSRTAALSEPYADAQDATGYLYVDPDAAAEHVVACTRAGLQAGFHAIGDRAVRVAVQAVAAAAERCGVEAVRRARHRLEHVEMLASDLAAELARLGVVASVQPVFDALWGGPDGMYADRVGRDRALAMNPFAALASAGVPLALGSDSPVTPLGPWEAVRAAAAHRTPGAGLAVEAAFDAHTAGGWRAAGEDGGVLQPGAPATYAVWDAAEPDGTAGLPRLAPGDPVPDCRATVVGGRVVHGSLDGGG